MTENSENPPSSEVIERPKHFFQPGVSGNPGGRPKSLKAVKKLAQKKSERAIHILAQIMEDETVKPVSRIAAANSILDRGYGKPSQEIKVEGGENSGQERFKAMARALSPEELREMQRMLAKTAAAVIEGVSVEGSDTDETVIEVEAEDDGPSGSDDEPK